MKLLHIVPSYLPATRYGGPIYSVHGLCKALAAAGHDVHVFTTNVDGDRDSDVPLEQPVDLDGVKVWYFPSKHLRRLYWSPPMRQALSSQLRRFDLVHLHSIFLWPTWAAARVARRWGKPYIVSPRGMLVKELIERKSRLVKSAWLALIEKANLENAAAIHVTSALEEQEARKFGYRFPPFYVVPNGVDLHGSRHSPFTFHFSQSSDHPFTIHHSLVSQGYLLFLGRINWKKGLDRLIEALHFIPDVNLVIAGNDEEGYRGKLKGIAAEKGVTHRIMYTGPVYGRDKAALFNGAAIFVLPSYSENFGNTVLEAMAAGCPVVVTPEVGAADIVAKTGAGLVLNGEPEVLGRGINDLLSRSGMLSAMGERGKRAVSEQYAWPAIARQMGAVYRKLRGTES